MLKSLWGRRGSGPKPSRGGRLGLFNKGRSMVALWRPPLAWRLGDPGTGWSLRTAPLREAGQASAWGDLREKIQLFTDTRGACYENCVSA